MPNRPSNYQTKLERVLNAFDSHQEKRLTSLRTQLKQQQNEVINKFDTQWKVVLEKFDNPHGRDVSKDPTPRIDAVYHAHHKNGSPRNKEIKSPSKLLSLKYQSQSSLREQNRSSSSPKRVYFVNTITIIRKEDESRDEGAIETDATKDDDHDTVVKAEEKVEEGLDGSKPEIEEGESRDIKRNDLDDRAYGETKEVKKVEKERKESDEEVEEELEEEEQEEDDPEYFDTFLTIEELSYHKWLLKN
ncbi:hypothetical protein Tco_1298443, partial [Tanacetum coccineum]